MHKKLMIIILSAALAAEMLTGCGTGSAEGFPDEYEDEEMYGEYDGDEGYEEVPEYEGEGMSDETVEAALSGEGAVTAFIGEPFYDGIIKNEDDALDALYSVVDRIGGDESTEFVIDAIDNTEDGIDYYSFRQAVGDISVYGAAAKVIADKNGKAIGLVSSILPHLEAPPFEEWAIDAGQAEDIVRSAYEGQKLRIYPEATEQTLIPIMEGEEEYQYTWVVYSDNDLGGDKTDAAFIAHYVSYEGEYIQSIPVSDIASDEALSGSVAEFAFADMESDTWTGTVKTHKGKKKNIEIPVMRDRETGKVYLGDAKRRILCADHWDFEYNDTLTPLEIKKGKRDDEAMITYDNFIRIYDLYEETGWIGPDGRGTASVLLMNAVDENGDPLDNACYSGLEKGFQVFLFDTAQAYGEGTDIVGHEFTHCVTGSLMTANLYLNDYGAINEAMSDILGNLAAIMTDDEDVPFIIGEQVSDTGMRSMKDPNSHEQPAFVWDKFYVPGVALGSDNNDNGGVHINSSLLNYVSYKLNSAGMEPEEEFYFWMNIARAMTPRTDYAQIAELLPWVMKTFGQDAFTGEVKEAIEETGIASNKLPDKPAEGLAYLSVDIPDDEFFMANDVIASVSGTDGSAFESWPEAGSSRITLAVPGGEYTVTVTVVPADSEENANFVYDNGEWTGMDDETLDEWMMDADGSSFIEMKAGDKKVLDGMGMAEQAVLYE